jgi:hypothetical protein
MGGAAQSVLFRDVLELSSAIFSFWQRQRITINFKTPESISRTRPAGEMRNAASDDRYSETEK